jgi:hypothetical protein
MNRGGAVSCVLLDDGMFSSSGFTLLETLEAHQSATSAGCIVNFGHNRCGRKALGDSTAPELVSKSLI